MIRTLTAAVAVACSCATARCGEIAAVLGRVRRACEDAPFYPKETTAERDEGGWRVTELLLRSGRRRRRLSDADLGRITELTSLERLTLWYTPVSSKCRWSRLGDLPRLRHLRLGGDAVERTSAFVTELGNLESLELSSREYPGDAAVARLRNLAHLKRLTLANWATDASLAHIRGLSRLEDLSLAESRDISEAAVCELGGWANLRSLEVHELSPKSVAALGALPRLESLTFERWSPDGGVVDLSGLSGLKSLTLGGMRESLDGEGVVARVRLPRALQRLQIGRDGCYTRLAEVLELVDPLPANIESVKIALRGHYPRPPGRAALPERLGMFAQLREVTFVDIAYEEIAARLVGSPRLRSLRLIQSPCGGVGRAAEGVIGLAAIRGLQSLVIWDMSAVNDDPSYLGEAAISALARLEGLRRFELRCSPTLTLDALEALPRLTRLEVLSLCLPQETADGSVAEGLAGLGSLVHLRELTLEGHVTDAGLAGLARLKGLRRLALREANGYTDAGLAALVKTLPELKVVRWQWLPSADWDPSELAAPAVREPPPQRAPEKKPGPGAAADARSGSWALTAGLAAAVAVFAVAVVLSRRRRAANGM